MDPVKTMKKARVSGTTLEKLFPVQNSSKIDLKIKISNFGPIAKGSIEMKPLTIFIGPNNSGKSYAARLIHSIILAQNKFNERSSYFGLNDAYAKIYDKCTKYAEEGYELSQKNKTDVIPDMIIKKIQKLVYSGLFANMLETTINDNFGADTHEIIRANQKSSNITLINSNEFKIKINRKVSMENKINDKPYKITRLNDNQMFAKNNGKYHEIGIKKNMINTAKNFFAQELLKKILTNTIQNNLPMNSFYLPAGRTGILQAHKSLSSSLIQRARFSGVKEINIPILSGSIIELISTIIHMSNKPGEFFSLGKALEIELFQGHIVMHQNANGAVYDIRYKTQEYEIPLHSASSTVSEIAPISLYLKYVIKNGDMLIIEEPEAHLHPGNQLILAKYIIKMIRAGINVLITTHSPFLLEKISEYLLASKIKPSYRKKILNDDDCYLRTDEISPYVFVKNGQNGYRISSIKMDDEYGIAQDEFVRIDDVIYSNYIKIQKILSGD